MYAWTSARQDELPVLDAAMHVGDRRFLQMELERRRLRLRAP